MTPEPAYELPPVDDAHGPPEPPDDGRRGIIAESAVEVDPVIGAILEDFAALTGGFTDPAAPYDAADHFFTETRPGHAVADGATPSGQPLAAARVSDVRGCGCTGASGKPDA